MVTLRGREMFTTVCSEKVQTEASGCDDDFVVAAGNYRLAEPTHCDITEKQYRPCDNI